jgi:hypothetical protein
MYVSIPGSVRRHPGYSVCIGQLSCSATSQLPGGGGGLSPSISIL